MFFVLAVTNTVLSDYFSSVRIILRTAYLKGESELIQILKHVEWQTGRYTQGPEGTYNPTTATYNTYVQWYNGKIGSRTAHVLQTLPASLVTLE
jgi:hypothetical protein